MRTASSPADPSHGYCALSGGLWLLRPEVKNLLHRLLFLSLLAVIASCRAFDQGPAPATILGSDAGGRELQLGMLGTGRTRIPMAACGTGLHLVRAGDSVHRFVVER